MLVLTRKQQQRIQIGENITITVVRISGNVVRVGIEAPGDVRVLRGELAQREAVEAAELETAGADEALGDSLERTPAPVVEPPKSQPQQPVVRPLCIRPHLLSLAVPAHAV